MSDNKNFKKWLMCARYDSGKTQEQVAADVDCSRAYIQQLEAGRHSPSWEMANRVADALGFEIRFVKKG